MPSLRRTMLTVSALLSAVAWLLASAATPAWVEDWASNREIITASVQGVPDLEESAETFIATVDAAIADGTSDVELTKMLMSFLVELDDDPRFQGFVAANESSASASTSSGSLSTEDTAGSDTGSSNSAPSSFIRPSVVAAAVIAITATLAA